MPSNTAVILIDPYNDFLHPNGKLYGLLADSLKEKDTIKHIRELLTAARANKIPVYYGLHQQWKIGNYDGWKHMAKIHLTQREGKAFEEGSWGAQVLQGLEPNIANGDVVVSKHWNSRSVHAILVFKLMLTKTSPVPFRVPISISSCINVR